MIKLSAVLAVCALLGAASARADAYTSPFRVNGQLNLVLPTLDNPYAPTDMAKGANGDSIMLFPSAATGAQVNYIQRYDAAGRALLSQPLSVGLDARRVAVAGNGNYAILSDLPDGSGMGVFVTVYNRAGSVLVPRFRVNDTIAGDQRAAAIAINASGMLAIAWTGPVQASSPSLYVKRFQPNGGFVASEALVFQTAASNERLMGYDLGIDDAGNSVITWAHGDIYSSIWSEIWGQRFAANGSALGGPFHVNTFTDGSQDTPKIAVSPAGQFIIVWESPVAGGGWGLMGQRFAAFGFTIGAEFRINPANNSLEGYGIAMGANGSFVVTWHDDSVGVPPQIVGRAFDAAGLPLGDRFIVSAAVNIWPMDPQIGIDAGGNFEIMWLQNHYSNQDQSDMLSRRYAPAGVAITPLVNGQQVTGLSGAQNSWRYYKLSVPTGQNTVEVTISGGSGDADLYLRWGALPTLNAWDGRPYLTGNNEGARMLNFPPGDWYIGVQGYNAYSGMNLQVSSR